MSIEQDRKEYARARGLAIEAIGPDSEGKLLSTSEFNQLARMEISKKGVEAPQSLDWVTAAWHIFYSSVLADEAEAEPYDDLLGDHSEPTNFNWGIDTTARIDEYIRARQAEIDEKYDRSRQEGLEEQKQLVDFRDDE